MHKQTTEIAEGDRLLHKVHVLKEKHLNAWQDQNPGLKQPPESYINILRLQKLVLEGELSSG